MSNTYDLPALYFAVAWYVPTFASEPPINIPMPSSGTCPEFYYAARTAANELVQCLRFNCGALPLAGAKGASC